MSKTVILSSLLIDGVSEDLLRNKSILVEDGVIAGIFDRDHPVGDADVIDLSDCVVMPGLIDCHVHLVMDMSQLRCSYIEYLMTVTEAEQAIMFADHARKTLLAGFTSARDLFSGSLSTAMKRLIDTGKIDGPRLRIARHMLSNTGGHGDFLAGLREDVGAPPERLVNLVDSPDQVRAAIRLQHRLGADVIKIAASGGVMSPSDRLDGRQFNDAELEAAVETAHMLGLKIAAHAHSKAGVEAALRAGVDSIEHGSFLDEETIPLFHRHGAYLVPTLFVNTAAAAMAMAPSVSPEIREKAALIGPMAKRMIHLAVKGGVKIAFGTDAGMVPHGINAQEFALLVAAGMSPMQAIRSATSVAAELLDEGHRVGSLQVGKLADIIAVSGNPLEDITRLEQVGFVMKGGRVFKNEFK